MSRDDVERVSSAFEAITATRVAVGVAVRDDARAARARRDVSERTKAEAAWTSSARSRASESPQAASPEARRASSAR